MQMGNMVIKEGVKADQQIAHKLVLWFLLTNGGCTSVSLEKKNTF